VKFDAVAVKLQYGIGLQNNKMGDEILFEGLQIVEFWRS
jgi:hypothetical protein